MWSTGKFFIRNLNLILPRLTLSQMTIDKIRDKVLAGQRLTHRDGLVLFKSNDLLALGRMATHVAKRRTGTMCISSRTCTSIPRTSA